jgi:superfamily II DNA or RNA helicase
MTGAAHAVLPAGLRLRTHQQAALDALRAREIEGRRRSWVVLPPGAGKTLVGLVTAGEQLGVGAVSHVVVLCPNTAIQGQWLAQATAYGLDADGDRDLDTELTALTYQSLAVFDPDGEVADDPQDTDEGSLIDALHINGRQLLERLRNTEGLLLVLDECHHLLEVWGRLLAEILGTIPDARVLGLTATPPEALTRDQADLVADLFGDVAYATSIPAVVKEGDLVPFAELAWLVEPTPAESDWLDAEAVRFTELTTALTRPGFAEPGFLDWLRSRFVDPVPGTVAWAEIARREPDRADAALRMHHHGLLALPDGARLTEQHRRPPTVDDWMALIDDWAAEVDDPDVTDALREALPSVGFIWTSRGVRRGRTPTDRVLARSAAKASACVDIVTAEHAALGDDLRQLVLCDHEEAQAVVPTTLVGVLDQQAGSAIEVLRQLLSDPTTRGLDPLLVTGRTVAGARETLEALRERVEATEPRLAGELGLAPLGLSTRDPGGSTSSLRRGSGQATTVYRLEGRWSSRTWVRHVTDFFESGGTRVLVGTRGLLGEGWDARFLSGLVDLTTATSLTAVVQTRGRALRTDPSRREKVAVTWSVTCVSDRHPRGANDWARLVRKHTGFHGVDAEGTVADGVAHLDSSFSPYAPPPVADFAAVNARMLVRAEDRRGIAEAWRVGEPYADRTAVAVRLRPHRADRLPVTDAPRPVLLTPAGLSTTEHGHELTPDTGPWRRGLLLGGSLLAVALVLLVAGLVLSWPLAVTGVLAGLVAAAAVVPAVRGWRDASQRTAELLRRRVADAVEPASLAQLARAVADGLHDAGLVSVGARAVEIERTPAGEYRFVLGGVDESESAVFATALEEAAAPLVAPRYVVSRLVTDPASTPARVRPTATALREAERGVRPTGEAWHAVPSVLATRAERVDAYLRAWRRWVGEGRALYAGSPEGAGVLAAQVGSDPFEVSAVMRRQWE